ncbi:hypothetical protein IJS77_03900 [bacterium]|nr:hypothetical protein [bacterium]
MKKLTLIILLLFTITSQSFANSIFKKEEKVEADKTQPFFINIYGENNNDISANFDEPELASNHQLSFYNKAFSFEENKTTDNFFISAKRSTGVNLSKNYVDTVSLSSGHTFGNWDLTGSVYQETVSGKNNYNNYIAFEPSYKINDKFSVFGGVSHSLTDNYDQTKIGIKWTPVKLNRFEFKLSVSNYTKQFYSYRNKLNFETTFKI